jgi:hypothetical protein
MGTSAKAVVLLLLLVAAGPAARGADIILKNGNVISGKIVRREADAVIVGVPLEADGVAGTRPRTMEIRLARNRIQMVLERGRVLSDEEKSAAAGFDAGVSPGAAAPSAPAAEEEAGSADTGDEPVGDADEDEADEPLSDAERERRKVRLQAIDAEIAEAKERYSKAFKTVRDAYMKKENFQAKEAEHEEALKKKFHEFRAKNDSEGWTRAAEAHEAAKYNRRAALDRKIEADPRVRPLLERYNALKKEKTELRRALGE